MTVEPLLVKLLGRDFSGEKVMAYVQARLGARGLASSVPALSLEELVEAPIDPLTFNLNALETHADASRGLPVETHRAGVSGTAVRVAKQLFRRAGQVFINEALGRQVVFNGHVRDSYAQLSAEVVQLRARLAALERHASTPPANPNAAPSRRKAKRS